MEQQAVSETASGSVTFPPPEESNEPMVRTLHPLQAQQTVGEAAALATATVTGNQPGAVSASVFTAAALNLPPPPLTSEMPASLGNLTTFNEVVNKLNRLFDDQQAEIEQLTDDHWKTPEFPLARIKKIMRMDDEVKMISAEVPIMLSKAIEIFISELTLRGWLHTEEAKRRTVQRSDIAMAITKHDMFDFLIDIVPREEIQVKAKAGLKLSDGDQMQLLSPELLQLYIQQLLQQQAAQAAEDGEEEGDQRSVNIATGLIQQQLQLLQQLIQLQQVQAQEFEQQQQNTTPLQHPPQSSQVLHHSPPSSLFQSQPTMDTGGRPISSQVDLPGGQQTLRHAPPDVLMDTQQPHSTTIVLPPQTLMEPQQSQQPPPPLLQTQGQYQLRHLDEHAPPVPSQGVQAVIQQVLDHGVSEHFRTPPPLNPTSATEGEVEFRHIPESESISRSISPITATLQHTPEVAPGYHHHHQDVAALSSETASSLASSLGLQSSDSLQNQLASIVSTGHGPPQTKITLANNTSST